MGTPTANSYFYKLAHGESGLASVNAFNAALDVADAALAEIQLGGTIGDLLYHDTASSLAKLADVATGNVLLSGGVGAVPVWGKVALAAMADMATGSLLGRNTVGDGSPEVITDIPTSVTIGSAYIYRVGGTDVSVPDGGTGLSTVATGSYLKGAGAGALVPRTPAEVKTDLSLNNVENTALSTWAGTANLTTVGAIVTGTWNATAIAANKGGTGQTSYAVGDLLYASAADVLSKLADVATGNVLLSGGVATAPAWGKVALTHMANLTANSILGNNTASPATPIALSTTQVKTLLAIAQADVAGLTTASSPTFAALTAASLTSAGALALNAGGADQSVTLTPTGTGSVVLGGPTKIVGNLGLFDTTPSNIYSVYGLKAYTDPANASAMMFLNPRPTYTGVETAAENFYAHYIYCTPIVNVSHVNSGAIYGQIMSINRNHLPATADNGSLSSLIGQSISFGHMDTVALVAPVSTFVTGLRIAPQIKSGTITTLYGIIINTAATGGSVTNYYGLYQEDTTAKNYFAGNIGMGTTEFGTSAAKVFGMANGTAPSTSPADMFQMYAADQAVGNSCPHVRTENGAVVKLFQGAALTAQLTTLTHTAPGTPDYAIQDLVQPAGYGFATKDEGNTVLSVIANLQTRVTELETRLKAHGLLA